MVKSRIYKNKKTRRVKNRNRRKSRKSIRGGVKPNGVKPNVVNMYFRDYEMYQSKHRDSFGNSNYIVDLIHITYDRLQCKKIKLSDDDIVLAPEGIAYIGYRESIGEEITRMYYAMIEYFKTLPGVKINDKDIIQWIQTKYNEKNSKQIKIIPRTNKEETKYIYDNDSIRDYDADDARNAALTVKGTEAGL